MARPSSLNLPDPTARITPSRQPSIRPVAPGRGGMSTLTKGLRAVSSGSRIVERTLQETSYAVIAPATHLIAGLSSGSGIIVKLRSVADWI